MRIGIDAYIDRCISIDNDERAYFHSILKPRKFAKKEHLLKAGEIRDWEAFVEKGCLRVYYLDENGGEVNLMFAIEDWWVSDLASKIERRPAEFYIEALDDTEVLMIKVEDKNELYRRIPVFESLFRQLLERALSTLQHRFVTTVAKPAEERYEEFLRRYPDIPNRVSQKHIAAYLGITPEFLSKIRHRRIQ
ncbi:MAG: Crp/Fnr family transcriptional regulator [Flavobacteriales bacterium]|nr:Crp/Fnr family transcriptional regulator [Flavobacteriales bacterium]